MADILALDLEAARSPESLQEELPLPLSPAVGLITCMAMLTKSSVASVLLRGSVVIVLLVGSRTLLGLLYTEVGWASPSNCLR